MGKAASNGAVRASECSQGHMRGNMTRTWLHAAAAAALLTTTISGAAQGRVPEPMYQQLKKMGQVVDVSCTAKLYRPLMPRNDYDTWWPPGT